MRPMVSCGTVCIHTHYTLVCVYIHTHTKLCTNQFILPNFSEGFLEITYSGSGKTDKIYLNYYFYFVYHDLTDVFHLGH